MLFLLMLMGLLLLLATVAVFDDIIVIVIDAAIVVVDNVVTAVEVCSGVEDVQILALEMLMLLLASSLLSLWL